MGRRTTTADLEMEDSSSKDTRALITSNRRKCPAILQLSCGLNGIFVIVAVFLAQRALAPAVDGSRDACSGHGMLFEQGGTCTCFDCWSGETCSERLTGSDCVVNANSGTPYLFESYWVEHPEAATTILASHHIGYGSRMPRLEAAIRALHALVGNAATDGREIVIGIGSTELISAALYALSPERATCLLYTSPSPRD